MNWMILVAIFAAGTLSTFTDWLFMGVLFHDRYQKYPEVWWPGLREKTADNRAIILSSIVGYLTSAAVVLLCMFIGANDIFPALCVAFLAWVAGPLVMQITNGFWIKSDPAITAAHAAGYLARFLIAGLAAAIVLP